MKGAAPGEWLIVVWKGVLLPLAIRGLSIEADVRMYGHTVIGEHALVKTLPYGGSNGLGRSWIYEEGPRLKYQNHARPKISAAPVSISGRTADNKHLTPVEGELPERIIGMVAYHWTGIVFV